MDYDNDIMTQTEPITDSMQPRRFRINNVSWETPETFTHELIPIDKGPSFTFLPGQFNMIYLYGVGEIPISISGDPDNTSRLFHTTRVVGSVTQRIQHLKPGDTLGIRGPYGNGWPVEKAEGKDVLIIAGGIGLAPLRPVLYHILHNRDQFGHVTLLYGTRSPDKILYFEELKEWISRFDLLDVRVTVDSASGNWRGHVGVVTKLLPKAMFEPDNTAAFVCGPEIMMRFVAMDLKKHKVPEHQVYLSMERNFKCGLGFCGHCQLGSYFICKDGPVFAYDKIKSYLSLKEV
ncbi:MAG TPA: FAD/NAD(P)-binding protein [Balneolales bacterium]|nr:FAD/NAD(P)-binding protein [Balneolales bacterium]